MTDTLVNRVTSLRESLDHLERILDAAVAVKDEIQDALDECAGEPRSTVREILNGVRLSDIEDIEGGLLDLKALTGRE
jgi:hypothetical protein